MTAAATFPANATANATADTPGALLRQWRQRRHLSQLDLACDADISQRHLSFIESGRSQPSRDMLVRLFNSLDVPLRDRNQVLLAAGFAPLYAERRLDSPELGAAQRVVDMVLKGHEPFPALAVDRHWNMVSANQAMSILVGGVYPSLLEGPINALRVSLHPKGLAPHIVNYLEWRTHILHRLKQQIGQSADPELIALAHELAQYPAPPQASMTPSSHHDAFAGIAIPLQMRVPGPHGEQVLSFLSTITVFGTPHDISLSELAIESFFPADEFTAQMLRQAAAP